MKFLTTLLKYLSYLSPILIKRYSCDFDSSAFLKSLRLNTESPYGDEKQKLRDRRIGRQNSSSSCYMSEYDNLIFIRNKYSYKINPFTLIWLTDKTKLKFTKISCPDLLSGIMILALIVLLIYFGISFDDSNKYNLFILSVLYLFLNFILHDNYFEQNDLINKALFYNRESLKSRESYE